MNKMELGILYFLHDTTLISVLDPLTEFKLF